MFTVVCLPYLTKSASLTTRILRCAVNRILLGRDHAEQFHVA